MESIICPYCQSLTEEYFCVHCTKDFTVEVELSNEGTLSEYQIDQQDYIDNACFNLLKKVAFNCDWDIGQIRIIRNALIDVLMKFHEKKEYDLYPWRSQSAILTQNSRGVVSKICCQNAGTVVLPISAWFCL